MVESESASTCPITETGPTRKEQHVERRPDRRKNSPARKTSRLKRYISVQSAGQPSQPLVRCHHQIITENSRTARAPTKDKPTEEWRREIPPNANSRPSGRLPVSRKRSRSLSLSFPDDGHSKQAAAAVQVQCSRHYAESRESDMASHRIAPV